MFELDKVDSKVSVVIPCFNNLDVLKQTIPSIYTEEYSFVVFDDGSTDGTDKWLKKNFPKIDLLKGDGTNWWTGSIKKGIDYSINKGAQYIVSLNADVLITPEIIKKLILCSIENSNSIVASLVVDIKNPVKILWAGSKFTLINKLIPIYSSKYIVKAGNLVDEAPIKPYTVDEVHGRGVLFPRKVFEIIGNYNPEIFQHYGGDTDFSFRAKKAGINMLVDPSCKAKVFVENTSLNKKRDGSIYGKVQNIKNYLFDRKSGEALYVWWNLYKRHLPRSYRVQSFIFVITLNIFRRLFN